MKNLSISCANDLVNEKHFFSVSGLRVSGRPFLTLNTHTHTHIDSLLFSSRGLHVNEDGGTEVGSALLWMLIREGLQIPADAPDMEDNGSACVAGALFSFPQSLTESDLTASPPRGQLGSPLDIIHHRIKTYRHNKLQSGVGGGYGVTLASSTLSFSKDNKPDTVHWLVSTLGNPNVRGVLVTQTSKLLNMIGQIEKKKGHLSSWIAFLSDTLQLIYAPASVWNLATNCREGSSCEATSVAGELLVAVGKHMSLPNGFPKGCGTHETPAKENTMKQQGLLAADVDRTVPPEIVCKKKRRKKRKNNVSLRIKIQSWSQFPAVVIQRVLAGRKRMLSLTGFMVLGGRSKKLVSLL